MESSKIFKNRNEESKKGLLCQDAVYELEKVAVQAITLADGTGDDEFAGIGAEHSCKILAELLVGHFDELYAMEEALVQFQIITNIQTGLYELSNQYGVDISRFQSTLLGIVIDHQRNVFIAVHLGDGSIRIQKNETTMMMSYPENGVNKSKTYLTSEYKVGKHIKVLKNEVKDINGFILISDGWNEKIMKRHLFAHEELLQNITAEGYMDDISFIALVREY